MIVGGGRIAFRLAKRLEDKSIPVKIIERRSGRCSLIAEKLNRAVVLCGDGSDQALLKEENIQDTDMVVTLTDEDETNILVSLLAKRLGARKTITKISKFSYFPLMHAIGIDQVVDPRLSAVNSILQHIRRGKVLSSVSIRGEDAEIMEAVALETTDIVGKPLRRRSPSQGRLVTAIVRGEQGDHPHRPTAWWSPTTASSSSPAAKPSRHRKDPGRQIGVFLNALALRAVCHGDPDRVRRPVHAAAPCDGVYYGDPSILPYLKSMGISLGVGGTFFLLLRKRAPGPILSASGKAWPLSPWAGRPAGFGALPFFFSGQFAGLRTAFSSPVRVYHHRRLHSEKSKRSPKGCCSGEASFSGWAAWASLCCPWPFCLFSAWAACSYTRPKSPARCRTSSSPGSGIRP